jgi:hypothetical protein
MGHISGTWELLLCEYWRKGNVHFVGDQHAKLDFYTASSLTPVQSVGRTVTAPWHILLISSQPVYVWLKYHLKFSFKELVGGLSDSEPVMQGSQIGEKMYERQGLISKKTLFWSVSGWSVFIAGPK